MSQAAYLRDLREVTRGYWAGVFTQEQFTNAMYGVIDVWLEKAWQEGAKSVGIMPDEITPAEQAQLAMLIFKEYTFIPRLAQFIYQNRRGEGLLRTVYARLTTWANRYKDVRNKAKVSGEEDPKMEWTLGPTEKSCKTCPKLHGKVKRKSWWRDNVMPQDYPNPKLECGGWNCQCEINKTDKPLSRGRMPNTP